GSETNGIIYLDGGTITTASIRKGASTLTAGPTQIAFNANGGTVQATGHIDNYFQNLYVYLDAGGLTFDSDEYDVSTSNVLHGTGSLTKTGTGMLRLAAFNTYSGDTIVEAGTLSLDTASLHDESELIVAEGAVVDLF